MRTVLCTKIMFCLLSLLFLGCGTSICQTNDLQKSKQKQNQVPKKESQSQTTTQTEDNSSNCISSSCKPQIEPLASSGEGMWPWSSLGELDEKALKKRGLEVPLEDLWTPGKGGLVRAAVGLRGCSASFVSADGLLITNHHCVFQAIQRNSTPERNLIEEGYLAKNRSEELNGHGIKVYIFQQQTDVTDQVLGKMPSKISDLERMYFIESREKELVKTCEEKPNTRCRISRNNDGLGFILLENLELKDVRLVAAPPRSLGEYGGEIDNWHWPRHTMDFSFVRAYVAPDGKPAAYAPQNVPFKPQSFFKVGSEGIDQGDLVMVVGTPYRTARYRTSSAVKDDLEWYYPLRESLFSEWLNVLKKTCAQVPQSCLPTASRVKGLDNALTNATGMIKGLNRAKILEKKTTLEKKWRKWIKNEEPSADKKTREQKFGKALDDLTAYFEKNKAGRDRDFLIRYILWGTHGMRFSRTITKWATQQLKPDAKREPGYQERDRDSLIADFKHAQRSLNLEADKRVLSMFLLRMGKLPKEQRLKAIEKALKGKWSEKQINRFVTKLYKKTKIGDEKTREAFFNSSLEELKKSKDSMIKLALDLADELDAWDESKKSKEGAMSRLRPIYIESLSQMRGKQFYPDANASPRISFATVTGYQPRDGIWHTPFTTLSGLAAKNTGTKPFDAPEKLIKTVKAKDFGSFAKDDLKDVPVCFLSNADTTGGNSGSPAIDGKGRLVGLNFDRVYENIAGDYGYNPPLSRNIMVDVRGILWYLERVLKANNILKEIGAAKK